MQTTTSIPSKYETKLNTGKKENDAFARRTRRFDSRKNTVPGPGSYLSHDKPLRDSSSISKSGLGTGFTSKLDRFTTKAFDATPASVNLGPGTYKIGRSIINETAVKRRNHAVFHTAHVDERARQEIQSMRGNMNVGPADYNPKDILKTSGIKNPVTTVFKSTSNRFYNDTQNLHSATFPGPGAYNASMEKRDVLAPNLSSAVFRSSTKRASRSRSSGAADLPSHPQFTFQGDLSRSIRERVHKHDPTLRVGPGTYNYQLNTLSDENENQKSSFFANDNLNRFGQSTFAQFKNMNDPVLPGPAEYDPAVKFEKPAAASSFSSSSARFGQRSGVRKFVPGPAYYHPTNDEGKKSYHYNRLKRWV